MQNTAGSPKTLGPVGQRLSSVAGSDANQKEDLVPTTTDDQACLSPMTHKLQHQQSSDNGGCSKYKLLPHSEQDYFGTSKTVEVDEPKCRRTDKGN